MRDTGVVRSMPRVGCSPDNSACEGFFGWLKTELFYSRVWKATTVDEFIETLHTNICGHNATRTRSRPAFSAHLNNEKVLESRHISVLELRRPPTSMPYYPSRKPCISRTGILRPYMEMILPSRSMERRSCLGLRRGSKPLPRSCGVSIRNGPSSVSTVLAPVPLHWLVTVAGVATASV